MPPASAVAARRGAGHSRRSGSDVVLPAREAGCRGDHTEVAKPLRLKETLPQRLRVARLFSGASP
jgi:hypothetical protein